MPLDIRALVSQHLSRFDTAPFLFVGSGFSRRYLQLEIWEDLLRKFAEPLSRPFEYYSSKVGGNLPQLGQVIAEEYHEYWWNSPQFADVRAQQGKQARTTASPLKMEISKYLLARKPTRGTDLSLDREIELLRRVRADGIITTNWDTFLESIFPDFKVYVGQSAILASHPQGVGEIFKIHGCVTHPDSLVLTSGDYAEFDLRNPYLTAKLLTIFVEHPVLFFGYSLSDENIVKIINQLAICLSGDYIQDLQDRLIFVQRDKTGRGDGFESTVLPTGSMNIPVSILRTNNFSAVFEALAEVRRKFPARLLRQMKEHVYQLVKTNDPTNKMFVLDLESASDISEVEVVYGVGISEKIGALGYMPIQTEDLFADVMTGGGEYDPKRIVEEVLPRLVKAPRKYVPFFKYLYAGGYLPLKANATDLNPRLLQLAQQRSRFSNFHPPKNLRRGDSAKLQAEYAGVEDLASRVQPEQAIFMIPFLEDKIVEDELREFILNNLQLINSDAQLVKTYFRSLVCMYDWLIFRRHI